MKLILNLLISLLCMSYLGALAQGCPNNTSDITTNTAVCGLYGDASGNSNWNWELGANDLNYCNLWYARTSSSSTLLTPMGSPFVNATVGKIAAISQAQDYTREKGWELLRRDFGCSHITSYPYFVLYNRYSSLMRIFIYENESHLFSSMSVKIQPTTTPYPATTASGDPIETAPDKYLSSTPGNTFGKSVISVSENIGGSNRWAVVEFNPSFDPNIANAVYTGAGLQFTIYAVQSYDLQASINGTTVSGSSPGLSFTPQNPSTTNSNGNTVFTAVGEKFTTYSKTFNDIKSDINGIATGISAFLALSDPKTLEGGEKKKADDAASKTSDLTRFADIFGTAASVMTGGVNVLKLAGSLVGLFTGGGGNKTPAPAPVYTSVNLTLTGKLTLSDVAQTFILRVPGTIQPDGNNATYFKCPMGIFNLVNTPKADTIVYNRTIVYALSNFVKVPFVAYKINDDIPVSFFDGTGLDLVSVQAAIVGKVQANSDKVASYDLFAPSKKFESGKTSYNYLRPDLEAGRLEVAFFDASSAHLHVFQTPYVNLECIKGMSINVPKTTTVSLRIKAILKRKDDPANTPIIYIQDYNIEPVQGTLDPAYRALLNDLIPIVPPSPSDIAIPPYANYTGKPSWNSDRTPSPSFNIYYSAAIEEADNSITTGTSLTVAASAQGVVFSAGNAVYLEPGFTAEAGCIFQAVINEYGYVRPACGTLQKQAYQYSGNCFNTTAAGLAQKPGTR